MPDKVKNWDLSKPLTHSGVNEDGPYTSTYEPLFDMNDTVVEANLSVVHTDGSITLFRNLLFSTKDAVRSINFGSGSHGDSQSNKIKFDEVVSFNIDLSMALLESEHVIGTIGFKRAVTHGTSTFSQGGKIDTYPYVTETKSVIDFKVKYGEGFDLYDGKKRKVANITFKRLSSREYGR
jgi:hypothetical protein